MKIRLIVLLFATFLTTSLLAQQQELEQLYLQYVDLLKNEEYEGAEEHWNILDRTRADDLKVDFKDCPLKLEVNSPLWQYLEQIRSGTAELRISVITISREFGKITYSIITPTDTLWGNQYALIAGVEKPQFVSAVRVFSDAWELTETDFVRLHYRDASLYTSHSAELADEFIRELARKLGVSNEKMFILETLKLNGFLCGSFGEVEMMSGKQGLGAYIKSYDAVVGKHLPQYQELAQFMVAYANDDLPAVTLPLMEHGTATFLGGRWGRSARVLATLGSYLYANDLTALDTLITASDFATFDSNPDFAYPLAGLFCEFLYEKLGRENYFALYRKMSGNLHEVSAISRDDFKQAVTAAIGIDWSPLTDEFMQWLPDHDDGGLAAGASADGELVYESGLKGILVRVYEDSSSFNVVAKLDSPDVKAAILLRQRLGDKYSSFLFAEQFPDTTFSDYHYGVLFSSVEAGTYSYLTNTITGKYISGLTGDELIYEPETGEVRFKVAKELLPPFRDYVLYLHLLGQ